MVARQLQVLIADGDPDTRNALRFLLSREENVQIAGEATTYEDLLHLASTLQPAAIIVDAMLPGLGVAALCGQTLPATADVIVLIPGSGICGQLPFSERARLRRSDSPERLLELLRALMTEGGSSDSESGGSSRPEGGSK